MKASKIVLAGGTGFIGKLLIDHWKGTDVDIVVLSRKQRPDQKGVRYVVWDGETPGNWVSELERADVVINLAGKSVDCRYTSRNRQLILRSRVNATKVLGEAIKQLKTPPQLWINSSSATIYRHAPDRQMDENTGEIETTRPEFRFSMEVCQAWEQAFWAADVPQIVHKVALRMAIVLGRDGGVLPVLKRLAYWGLGGTMGDGKQFISWLHERDLVRIIDFIIQNDTIAGIYNASAPHPIRNESFMRLLRQAVGIPIGLRASEWMLKIGAILLRTETELVLKSRNVVPGKLVEAGFQFEFKEAKAAINDLIAP
ncbi:TIGR01777 family oxidoreductase [Spirosoma gilvum]